MQCCERKCVSVEIVVEWVVAVSRVQADFDVVFGASVASENLPHPVAEIPLYLQHESADPLFWICRAIRQDLLGERVHAAAGFSGPDGARMECDLRAKNRCIVKCLRHLYRNSHCGVSK